MKKSLLLLSVTVITIVSNAQQDPQFTQWMFDRLSFNPAAAGMKRMHCIQGFNRDQWDGFDRDPKTYLFNYNGYLVQSGMLFGMGASFYTEVLGQETNTVFRPSFAYHHQVGANTLSVGLQPGFYSKRLGNDWRPIDPDDPSIPFQGASQGNFDLSLGLMFYNSDKWYAGASATHLTAAKLDDLFMRLARHYYFMGGYNYDINGDLVLRTNALLKSDFKAPAAFDINANVLWNNSFWGGLAFRPGDAVAPMVGFQKDLGCKTENRKTFCQSFMVGYSYDITLSEIRNYSAGSHEIFATYCFNFSKTPNKARHGNPRFL